MGAHQGLRQSIQTTVQITEKAGQQFAPGLDTSRKILPDLPVDAAAIHPATVTILGQLDLGERVFRRGFGIHWIDLRLRCWHRLRRSFGRAGAQRCSRNGCTSDAQEPQQQFSACR